MARKISDESLDQLFLSARSHHAWMRKDVDEELLYKLYDIGKWGPTSANSNPARLIFVKSAPSKEKLYPALMGSNVDQVRSAPVTVIVAQDMEFYENYPRLMPEADARSWFAGNPPVIEATAFRNSSLQGAYFILAARALGLDVCPMSGFDNSKVDELFLGGTKWKSNFIFTLGYGDESKLFPRGPRLEFSEVAKII